MFNIHKNGNNKYTTHSTIEFYIFLVRWRVKKLSSGGGAGGTILIMSWKSNFTIYLDIQVYSLDIQAITTLYAFYWLFMC